MATGISTDMQSCIDDCLECYRTCLSTAMGHCLEQGGEHVGKIGMALGLNWYGRPDAPFREFPHFELKKGVA